MKGRIGSWQAGVVDALVTRGYARYSEFAPRGRAALYGARYAASFSAIAGKEIVRDGRRWTIFGASVGPLGGWGLVAVGSVRPVEAVGS